MAFELSFFVLHIGGQSGTGAPCSQGVVEKALDHRQGGNGRALGKKATVGDLIPEVSILINSLI